MDQIYQMRNFVLRKLYFYASDTLLLNQLSHSIWLVKMLIAQRKNAKLEYRIKGREYSETLPRRATVHHSCYISTLLFSYRFYAMRN